MSSRLLASWWIPYRYERSVVTVSACVSAAALAVAGAGMLLPVTDGVRLVLVVACSLVVNLLTCIQQVYLYQCLSRGTTERGRARTLQVAFTLGPMAAVAGSLGAQALLDGRWLALTFPANFAAVYLLSIPCLLVIALAGSRQRVWWDVRRGTANRTDRVSGGESSRPGCARPRWCCSPSAYALCCAAVACEGNLTLYVQSAVGKRPELLVGYIMAVRFTGKSIGGLILGWVAFRWGARAAFWLAITVVTAVGCLWAISVAGLPYFVCFALLGTGELAGAYFPNYCLSISTLATGARKPGDSLDLRVHVRRRSGRSRHAGGLVGLSLQLCPGRVARSRGHGSGGAVGPAVQPPGELQKRD